MDGMVPDGSVGDKGGAGDGTVSLVDGGSDIVGADAVCRTLDKRSVGCIGKGGERFGTGVQTIGAFFCLKEEPFLLLILI